MNNDIKFDQHGNIDVDYYIVAAKRERDAYLSEMFADMKKSIAKKLSFRLPKVSVELRRPAH